MITRSQKPVKAFSAPPHAAYLRAKTGLRVVPRNQSAPLQKVARQKQPIINKAVWTLGKIAVFQALLPMAAATLLGKISWEAGLIGGVAVWLGALALSIHTRVIERMAYASGRAGVGFVGGVSGQPLERIESRAQAWQVPNEIMAFRQGRSRLSRFTTAFSLWVVGALTGFFAPLRNHFDVKSIGPDASVDQILGLNGEDPFLKNLTENLKRWKPAEAAFLRLPEKTEAELTTRLSRNDACFFVGTETGGSVHFVRAGNPKGKKVLLLPGFPEDVFCFKNIIPTLAAAGMDVLAVDLVGKGQSQTFANNQTFSLPVTAANLCEVLRRLNFIPDKVAGHSFGLREWDYLVLQYPNTVFPKVPQSIAIFAHEPGIVDAGQAVDFVKDTLPAGSRFMGPFATRLGFNLPGLGVRTTVADLIGNEVEGPEKDTLVEEYSKVYDRDGHFGIFLGTQMTRALYGLGHMHYVLSEEHAAFFAATASGRGRLKEMQGAPKVIYAKNDQLILEAGGTPTAYAEKLAAAYAKQTGKPVTPIGLNTGHLGIFTEGKTIARIILQD